MLIAAFAFDWKRSEITAAASVLQSARIFHADSTASAQPGMSTALRLSGLLDILF